MPYPTTKKMQAYIATARQRQYGRQQALAKRRQRGLAIAKEAAQILRQEFGVRRVVLFGSVLNEPAFHETSDLDLAVWGLATEHYLKAVTRLMELPEFSIDLVEVESASPHLQPAIAQGLEL